MSGPRTMMTASERVLWRQMLQAAHEAAGAPEVMARVKALKKALAPSGGMRLPDLRPLPCAVFRGFLLVATGFCAETDAALRGELARVLAGVADAAGDVLDGLSCDQRPEPSWMSRADLS